VSNLSLSLSLDLSLRVYVQTRARERQRQSGETITHRDPRLPGGLPASGPSPPGWARPRVPSASPPSGRAGAGRVAGWCRLPAVAVAGFVHMHVHGVFVPYTRRREARAQARARSQSVTIRGCGGRAVCGPCGPPVAVPHLNGAARLSVLLEPVVDPPVRLRWVIVSFVSCHLRVWPYTRRRARGDETNSRSLSVTAPGTVARMTQRPAVRLDGGALPWSPTTA